MKIAQVVNEFCFWVLTFVKQCDKLTISCESENSGSQNSTLPPLPDSRRTALDEGVAGGGRVGSAGELGNSRSRAQNPSNVMAFIAPWFMGAPYTGSQAGFSDNVGLNHKQRCFSFSTIRRDMHSVDTFIDEAIGFTKRHPDLDGQQQAFGGSLMGFMKAIAECPDCPGVFRIPFDSDWKPNAFGEWKYLGCPKCEKFWTYTA